MSSVAAEREHLPEAGLLAPENSISPDYISAVERKGDVFDVLKEPMRHFPAHKAIKYGSVTFAVSESILWSGGFDSIYALGSHSLYAAGAALGAEGIRQVRRRTFARRVERKLEPARELSECAEEPLELIRRNNRQKRKREVQLFWGAEFDIDEDDLTASEVRTRLEGVIALAEKSGLETVVIPNGILDFAEDTPEKEAFNKQAQTIKTWLKQSKKKYKVDQKITVDGDDDEGKPKTANKQVLALDIASCRSVAELLGPVETPDFNRFAYAWEMLRTARPTHVMFRNYAAQSEKLANTSVRNGIHQQARRTIANQLANELDDWAVVQGPDYQRMQVTLRGSIGRDKPIAHLRGSQRVNTVNGQESVHTEDSGPLLHQLGLSPDDLRVFFEDPHKLSEKKRIVAAETVMLYELSGWKLPYEEGPNLQQRQQVIDAEGKHYPLLQQSVALSVGIGSKKFRRSLDPQDRQAAKEVSHKPLLSSRSARLIGVFVIAAALTKYGTDILLYPSNHIYEQSVDSYIEEVSQIDPQALLDRINQLQPSDEQIDQAKLEAMLEELEKSGKIPNSNSALYDDFRQQHPVDPYSALTDELFVQDIKTQEALESLSAGRGSQFDDDSPIGEDQKKTDEATQNHTDSSQTKVGNVNTGGAPGNPALWRVQAQGMSTKGYWAQQTYDFLSVDGRTGLEWGQYEHHEGQFESENPPMVIPSISAEAAEATNDWIHVSTAQPTDISAGHFGNTIYYQIPVLEGTVPVAATITQTELGTSYGTTVPSEIAQLNDGTFALTVNTEDGTNTGTINHKFDVNYWLRPVEAIPDVKTEPVHAARPLFPYSLTNAPESITESIDNHVPNLPHDQTERTEQLESYISNTFDYELSPFELINDEQTEDQVVQSLTEFTDLTLEEKEANCNTANTTLIIDNQTLNAVGGFNNGGPGKNGIDALSRGESHLWAVAPNGTKYDATPVNGVDADESSYFDENYTEEDFERKPTDADIAQERLQLAGKILAVAGMGLAVGYAFRRRKNVIEWGYRNRQAYVELIGKRSAHKLNKLLEQKPKQVSQAVSLMEQATFSPSSQTPGLTAQANMTADEITTKLHINQVRNDKRSTRAAQKRIKHTTVQNLDATTASKAARLGARLNRLQRRASRRRP